MKRLDWMKKLPWMKIATVAGVLAFVGGVGFGAYSALKPVFKAGLFHSISEAAHSIHLKVVEINRAVDENAELRIENAKLHRQIEEKVFTANVSESKRVTQTKGSALKASAGSSVARLIEGIQFEVPKTVSVSNLFTLAVSYVRAEEFEKAAKILHHLVYEQSNHAYQTLENELLLGVVLYQLDHYEGADKEFSAVLKSPVSTESIRFHAQARLWKAIVSEKIGKKAKAQYWMRELVDHHPHSTEASWVNSGHRPKLTVERNVAHDTHGDKGTAIAHERAERAREKTEHHSEKEHAHEKTEAHSAEHGGGGHDSSHH